MTAEDDIWNRLRELTAARIGLKRTGASLATAPLLALALAHARARDAVHETLDAPRLAAQLDKFGVPVLLAASAAVDRQAYLMRPDLGRRLAADAGAMLNPHAGDYDVVFVAADGLSARAVQTHAAPVLSCVIRQLHSEGWRIGPIVIVAQGRVAIADAVAQALRAQCVVILIGERPGLSAPDSMGIYLTWQPRADTTDAERNCISNVRPEGLGYDLACGKLLHLLRAIRERRLSGVALKDDSDSPLIGG